LIGCQKDQDNVKPESISKGALRQATIIGGFARIDNKDLVIEDLKELDESKLNELFSNPDLINWSQAQERIGAQPGAFLLNHPDGNVRVSDFDGHGYSLDWVKNVRLEKSKVHAIVYYQRYRDNASELEKSLRELGVSEGSIMKFWKDLASWKRNKKE
jgi:hypothetical protein